MLALEINPKLFATHNTVINHAICVLSNLKCTDVFFLSQQKLFSAPLACFLGIFPLRAFPRSEMNVRKSLGKYVLNYIIVPVAVPLLLINVV